MTETIMRTEIPSQQPIAHEIYEYDIPTEHTDSKKMVYRVILKVDEDGRFVATCPNLQGVVTDGATEEEAMENVWYAISDMLAVLGKPNKEFNLEPIVIFWVSKLPVVTNREMANYLQKKGFTLRHGRRHDVFSNGVRRTQVPRHGNQELGKGLLKAILEQAGIDIEEFKREF